MDDFIEKKLCDIELIIKEIRAYRSGEYKILHTPFLFIDNSRDSGNKIKSLNSENKSQGNSTE